MQCDECRAFHLEDHDEPPPCETDEEYVCERALMRDNPLRPGNVLAKSMYGKVATQFVADFHLGPFILESNGYRCGMHETNVMLDKLSIIHAVKTAKKEAPTATDGDTDGPQHEGLE